jgi:hypothetical protein
MIFPPGSEFIFGSWACKTDEKGNLQERLVEAQEDHGEFILSTGSGDLVERLSKLKRIDSGPINNQIRLQLWVGILFEDQSGFSSKQAEFFFNG